MSESNSPPRADGQASVKAKVLEKGAPIIIPNAENLSPEEIKKIKHREKMRRYMARKSGKEPVERETKQEIRKIDTTEMVELSKDTRNKAIQILDLKLSELAVDKDALAKVNLATLATVFGILFDKTQLMTGMATENIAIQANININMSADDALDELNKMREKYSEEHSK